MREGYLLTKKEAGEIFLILAIARLKLPESKIKTMAQKYWEKFEVSLGISPLNEETNNE